MARGVVTRRLCAVVLVAGSLAAGLFAYPAAGPAAGQEPAPAPGPVPGSAQTTVPISDRSLPGLRYQAHDQQAPELPWREGGHRGVPFTLADTDGDGRQELVTQLREAILLRRHDGVGTVLVDQYNLPPGYVTDLSNADLIAHDAQADGRDEVAVLAPHIDGSHWRLWILDLEAQRPLGTMILPTLPGRRRDGVWDGAYVALGSVTPPGAPRPLLVLLRDVAHDLHGRGLLGVDPIAGEVVWQLDLDGRPHGYASAIADLDGDGRAEILVGTSAVNNLEGRRLYGASDDSSRVFVLEADGRLRWQRAFGGPGSAAVAMAADLDGRPGLEAIVASGNLDPALPTVVVLDAQGRVLASHGHRRRKATKPAVLTADGQPALLAVRYSEQYLELLAWKDGSLRPEAHRTVRRSQNGLVALDVLPDEPGQELVIVGDGEILVCDRKLETLAGLRGAAKAAHPSALAWRVAPDHVILFPHEPDGRPVAFAPAPERLHPAWFAGGGALALGTVVLWRRRRPRPDAAGVETDPVVLRELRLQLLARLAKGGHEKIGALQALRRLVWRLDAEVAQAAAAGSSRAPGRAVATTGTRGPGQAMAAGSSRGPGHAATLPRSTDRLAAALATLADDTIPRLREILVLGRRTGAPTHLLNTGADILDDLATLPADAHRGLPHLHERATTLAREAEANLQRLRRAVEGNFRSDLATCFARVLAAQQETLEAVGITVILPASPRGGPARGGPPEAGPWVAIDPQDLEFVLDNLVGNAARAMEDSAERRLTVDWDQVGHQVLCTVTDTGLGIAPEDHEMIFEDGWSDRPGGGYGLARSRRDLHLYGGSLRVLESRAGHGTTFELVLPAAGPPAGSPA